MRASRSETDGDRAGGDGGGRRSARTRRAATIAAASIAWAALAGGGFFGLTAYGAVAGLPADAPRELPAELAATLRPAGGATLVLVAHPACPCTRASLRELERVLGSVAFRRDSLGVDVVVLFIGPRRAEASADRVAVDLRKLVGSISGVRIVDDPEGAQASRLGARTSGTVLFYDDGGTLRFAGGITPGRGHEGDSAGADALRALLARRTSKNAEATPYPAGAAVYGCGLTDGSTRP